MAERGSVFSIPPMAIRMRNVTSKKMVVIVRTVQLLLLMVKIVTTASGCVFAVVTVKEKINLMKV